jgi:hypothetical protein
MDFEYDVAEDHKKARARYDFDKIRPGASLHVKTHDERCRVLAAFRYWVLRGVEKKLTPRRDGAYAVSAQVGEEDPKGPGYRIWFKSKSHDALKTAEKCDAPGDI